MAAKDQPKLTAKQDAFVREYLIDLNATQAAIRAGYSKKTAGATGSENLSKPEIQEAIAIKTSERNERVQVDADWVLKKAMESFTYNAQEVYDNDGNPKMINANAAARFLEMTGKHVSIKAFASEDKDKSTEEDLAKAVNGLIGRLPN